MHFVRRPTPLFQPFSVAPEPAEYVIPIFASEKAASNGNPNEGTNEKDKESPCTIAKNSTTVSVGPHVNMAEDEDCWTLSMDVPGVKADHVFIDEKEGTLKVAAERKNGVCYQKHFVVDPKIADVTKLSAQLSDGVLTISIPKRPEPAPITITVSSEEPPEDMNGQFHFSLDLPGVKAANVQLQFKDDKLFLWAERTRLGTASAKIERVVQVKSSVDMVQAKAYLCDGVFTLVAPEAGAKESTENRRIPVNASGTKPVIETVTEDA